MPPTMFFILTKTTRDFPFLALWVVLVQHRHKQPQFQLEFRSPVILSSSTTSFSLFCLCMGPRASTRVFAGGVALLLALNSMLSPSAATLKFLRHRSWTRSYPDSSLPLCLQTLPGYWLSRPWNCTGYTLALLCFPESRSLHSLPRSTKCTWFPIHSDPKMLLRSRKRQGIY